jgi:hypothetical protein
MLGTLDDDFVSAHAIHLPEEAVFFSARDASFRNQGRKLVVHDPYPPSGTVGRSPLAVSQGFRWSPAFVARAEGTVFFVFWKGWSSSELYEIVRAFRSLAGNDDPLFRGRVLSQFWHGIPLFWRSPNTP